MIIQIIYDYNLSKLEIQYNYIKNIFPTHKLIIYEKKDVQIKKKSKYNIYIDVISENQYNMFPSENHILIVNDEYITINKYLRKESYDSSPLILIDDIINYYFCLTQYSFDILSKSIKKKKIIFLPGLICHIYKPINNKNTEKYILYEIDQYSMQYNINILTVWLKHFINRPEKLIIKYSYISEIIIAKFQDILKIKVIIDKIYFYKNIILFKDNSFLLYYINNINLVIINNSYYNFLYKLYENILYKNYIITIKNDISINNLHSSNIFLDDFNENHIYNALNKYFLLSNTDKNIIINYNIDKLEKNMVITQKKIKNLLI
jgi:hypothetical protein